MDLDRSSSSCHSNIWPNNCGRPGWWFSKTKRTDCQNRKSEARLGKPPSLLRLSSTGDSVVEDTVDFRTFGPSSFQRSGSDSVDICAKSNTTATPSGIFDHFRRIAFSATSCGINSSGGVRQTTMNLMRGSETSLPDQTDQVNLDVLTAKFDHREVEMERQGQHHQGNNMQYVKHEQGGMVMNGYVEEGIYHPYARNVESRPSSQPFRCFNFTSRYHHHRHPHPYLRRNDFIPHQRTSLHHCASLIDPRIASAAPRSQVMDHIGCVNNQKRTVLQCQMSVPRIVPHSTTQTSVPSIAVQMQCHVTHQNNQQKNAPCCGHRDQSSRNPIMMKKQTGMTHQNKSPAKSTGCSHQTQRPSQTHSPKNTTPLPSKRCHGQKPVQHARPESPMKAKPKKQDLGGSIETCKLPLDLKESEKKNDCGESVITNVNLAKGEINDQNGKIPDPGPIVNLLEKQALQQTDIASSLIDFDQLETDCCVPTEPETHSHRSKSEDNETTDRNPVCMVTACTQQTVTNLPQPCVRQALQEDDEDRPIASIANEDTPPVHTQSISTPSSTEIPSSSTETVSSDSHHNSKPLHSSLAFILSETVANDSDFSDSDWDSTATSPSHSSDSWDFLKCWNDPYNPLYGWKCANRTDQLGKERDVDASKVDSSFGDDEIDSGISSLHLQQDEIEEASAEDSDSWDEEESEEECQLWKSFCPTNDPYNPLNGWMCNNSKTRTENATTTSQKPNAKVQLKTELQKKPMQSRTPPECLTFQGQGSVPPPKSVNLHPSVLFILGIDESDSDNAIEDEDDFDGIEDEPDQAWECFETSDDPYSPLQGWKLHSHPAKKLPAEPNSAIRPVSLSINTDYTVFDSSEGAPRRKSAVEIPRVPETKPLLKRASSTGCLWIPCGGQGSGQNRPSLNKKVHFCEASPTIISFEVPTWSNEYSDSRKGPWQEMARDRCRFMDRIRSTELQIAHVFTPDHRLKVQRRLHYNCS